MKKNIVIIILCILLAISLGYIAYEKVLTKQPKEIKTEEKKEETKFETAYVASNEVVTLYNLVDVFNEDYLWCGENYYNYLYKQDKLEISNIPNEVIISVGVQNALKAMGDTSVMKTDREIDATEVDKSIKRIFGNISYEKVSVNDESYRITYKPQTNVYLIDSLDFSPHEYHPMSKTRIIKAEKNDKELNIYTNILYAEIDYSEDDFDINKCAVWSNNVLGYCVKGVLLYKDLNKTQLIEKTLDYIWDNSLSDISEDTMVKYQEQLDTYKLHFEKEDGEYHFKSIMKQ